MMNFLILHGKWIVGIYIVLTIIKLFTANVYYQREEDPTFYFKFHPTITNTFGGSDRDIEFYISKYSWYENNQYWKLFHTNGQYAIAAIYSTLIFLWWALSVGLIAVAICKLLK